VDALDKGCLLKTAFRCLLLFMTLTAAVSASAHIFSRRPVGAGIPALLQDLGGQRVYNAPVRINGEPGLLAVTGFADPQHRRMAEIAAALQLGAPRPEYDSLHIIERAGTVTRLLLLRPGGGDMTIAVTIEQASAAFRQGRDAAARRSPDSPLPLFPGATPGLHAENEDTGLRFVTQTATAAAPRVAAFYQAALLAAGWQQAFTGDGLRPGLLFLRENALCMVLISPASAAAATHITLLYKPMKSPSP
jgi:hypothetical protein